MGYLAKDGYFYYAHNVFMQAYGRALGNQEKLYELQALLEELTEMCEYALLDAKKPCSIDEMFEENVKIVDPGRKIYLGDKVTLKGNVLCGPVGVVVKIDYKETFIYVEFPWNAIHQYRPHELVFFPTNPFYKQVRI